jgi:hypothetical protein
MRVRVMFCLRLFVERGNERFSAVFVVVRRNKNLYTGVFFFLPIAIPQ